MACAAGELELGMDEAVPTTGWPFGRVNPGWPGTEPDRGPAGPLGKGKSVRILGVKRYERLVPLPAELHHPHDVGALPPQEPGDLVVPLIIVQDVHHEDLDSIRRSRFGTNRVRSRVPHERR